MTVYDALVVAGGGARRFGGTDKTRLQIAGLTLLDRVLDAVPDAATTVVVGLQRPTLRSVTWTTEQPPGGGPAAAVQAGLTLVSAPQVVVLAADLPFLSGDTVARLLAAIEATGAVAVGADDREQWLISAWRTEVLREAALVPGGSLRAALAPLRPRRCEVAQQIAMDCDTPADLDRAREWERQR